MLLVTRWGEGLFQQKMKEVIAKYGMELLVPPLFRPLRMEHNAPKSRIPESLWTITSSPRGPKPNT